VSATYDLKRGSNSSVDWPSHHIQRVSRRVTKSFACDVVAAAY